jgi:hypothetical protein
MSDPLTLALVTAAATTTGSAVVANQNRPKKPRFAPSVKPPPLVSEQAVDDATRQARSRRGLSSTLLTDQTAPLGRTDRAKKTLLG